MTRKEAEDLLERYINQKHHVGSLNHGPWTYRIPEEKSVLEGIKERIISAMTGDKSD